MDSTWLARVIVRSNDAAASQVESIDNHKTTRGRNFGVNVKGNGFARVKGQFGNLVAANEDFILLPGNSFQCRSIDNALDGFNAAFGFLRSELELVSFVFRKGLFAKPKEPGLEARQFIRRGRLVGGDCAASDEDLFGQGNTDGFAG